MAVIKYQLIIIVTIAIAFAIGGKKPALIASGFWTLWTIILLYYPPLIFTQLLFTWGTFFVCYFISTNRKKIADLQRFISEYPISTQEHIQDAAKKSKVVVISGKRHRLELFEALKSAQQHIVILSGWISSGVVDRDFCRQLEIALSRGVKVYIGYGWQDSMGEHRQSRFTGQGRANLESIKSRHPDNIFIGVFANHEKLLLKDFDYVICGSNNWLSNRYFRNSERSMKIYDRNLASSEYNRTTNMIRNAVATP